MFVSKFFFFFLDVEVLKKKTTESGQLDFFKKNVFIDAGKLESVGAAVPIFRLMNGKQLCFANTLNYLTGISKNFYC